MAERRRQGCHAVKPILLAPLAMLGLPVATGFAQCVTVPAPVISVDLPSRYAQDDKTRSAIDEAANARVNEGLAPVDDFVAVLARQTTDALRLARLGEGEKARLMADCVLAGLERWAASDALSQLDSLNAKQSIPSRLGGAAFAYGLAAPLATRDPARSKVIGGWLVERATATMAFFDDPKTSTRTARNNLRMWAALSVLRTGIDARDKSLIGWAEASFRRALCEAHADGSLPHEMSRGSLALHYQLHAMQPLVVGVALLRLEGIDLRQTCDNALTRIVMFTLAAVDMPALATAHAGERQKRITGRASLEGFHLAWIPAWQSLSLSPALDGYAPAGMVLSNSRLGGDQVEIWGRRP
jgi:poly(beta-D-mannuronate) lyase